MLSHTSLSTCRYAPERYLYKEGMKLAAKYAEEEKALAEELKVRITGVDGDVTPS